MATTRTLIRQGLASASSSSSRMVFTTMSRPPRSSSAILSQIPKRWASQVPIPGPSIASSNPSVPSTASTSSTQPGDPVPDDTLRLDAPTGDGTPQRLGKIEPRLQMTFTCTADECGHRSTHQFAKSSYQKGIVLVQCPACKNRHLIADHLGWFNESTGDGKMRTIEDILRAKGESIRKGRVGFDGDIEIDSEGNTGGGEGK